MRRRRQCTTRSEGKSRPTLLGRTFLYGAGENSPVNSVNSSPRRKPPRASAGGRLMKRSARGNGRVICAVSIWKLSLKRLDYSKRLMQRTPPSSSSAVRSKRSIPRQRTKGRRHGTPTMKSGQPSTASMRTAQGGRPSISLSRSRKTTLELLISTVRRRGPM